jgi:hypothetical protein
VDLPGHRAITRVAACEIAPDNDLGERLVTRDVGELAAQEINIALASGAAAAEECIARGLVRAAAICLQGETRVADAPGENCRFLAAASEENSRRMVVAGS